MFPNVKVTEVLHFPKVKIAGVKIKRPFYFLSDFFTKHLPFIIIPAEHFTYVYP